MTPKSVTVNGVLNADGTLELAERVHMPAGPVRVTLTSARSTAQDDPDPLDRLPDPPSADECIPALVDLPRPRKRREVQVRRR